MAQASAQKCFICTEKNSVFYCYECQHALCAVCRERHDKVPALSGHTIADINVIDLSNVKSDKVRCVKHKKDYLYYCAKCRDLICGKCATSSHKGHSFSDISETVSERREAAQTALQKLKTKIEDISSVQDTVRDKHLEKLHLDSQEMITDITATFKELHTFTKSKEDIKKTEVEDNKRIAQQSIELFLKNTGLIRDRYTQVYTALQNILCEKHDITFYKLYNAIDKDIIFLDDIPKEPIFHCVPSFDRTILYTEMLQYVQSKADTRICKNCITQEKKLVDIVAEKKQLERDVESITVKLKAESNEVKRLLMSIKDMKTDYARKQEENNSLSKEIKSFKKSDFDEAEAEVMISDVIEESRDFDEAEAKVKISDVIEEPRNPTNNLSWWNSLSKPTGFSFGRYNSTNNQSWWKSLSKPISSTFNQSNPTNNQSWWKSSSKPTSSTFNQSSGWYESTTPSTSANEISICHYCNSSNSPSDRYCGNCATILRF